MRRHLGSEVSDFAALSKPAVVQMTALIFLCIDKDISFEQGGGRCSSSCFNACIQIFPAFISSSIHIMSVTDIYTGVNEFEELFRERAPRGDEDTYHNY